MADPVNHLTKDDSDYIRKMVCDVCDCDGATKHDGTILTGDELFIPITAHINIMSSDVNSGDMYQSTFLESLQLYCQEIASETSHGAHWVGLLEKVSKVMHEVEKEIADGLPSDNEWRVTVFTEDVGYKGCVTDFSYAGAQDAAQELREALDFVGLSHWAVDVERATPDPVLDEAVKTEQSLFEYIFGTNPNQIHLP